MLLSAGPSAFLLTVVKRGATIGANATIVCGVTIGKYAFIGAGAVVVRDVSPHSLVIGDQGASSAECAIVAQHWISVISVRIANCRWRPTPKLTRFVVMTVSDSRR